MTLSDIKGIGAKRIEKLNKAGFYTPLDLLNHFPVRYIDARQDTVLREANDGDAVVVTGTPAETPAVRYVRRGLSMVRVRLVLDTGETVWCTWFNQKYIVSRLTGRVTVAGRLERFRSSMSVKGPLLIPGGGIVPVYAPIRGLPQSVFLDALRQVFARVTVRCMLPETLRRECGLMDHDRAYRLLHFPVDAESLDAARRTVAIDRLAFELTGFKIAKSKRRVKAHSYADKEAELEAFTDRLPFRLTDDQNAALSGILNDMKKNVPMNRMLQGDVGSGKTIVALTAMYYACLNGYQSAMMAPTEILAVQHYKTALRLFAGTDVHLEFLSGSASKARRDAALFNIRSGSAQMVFGTHALLSESVAFRALALVVTDEQHRFGVSQRGAFENKSPAADCLVMSATPIPRTLALVYYGDLEQSVIAHAPKAKAKVTTRLVPVKKREDMLAYVREKAEAGEQTYLVCPRVEGDDDLVSAEELYAELGRTALKPYLGLLHGQQKDSVKTAVMEDFYTGKIKILCTTSVIEVGIDVPQATTVVIFDADRYGLSQLHQLRGRVGRGSTDSYCFLLSDTASAGERLAYFCRTDDGFALAEYDFRQRGAGDFIGTRQHGGAVLDRETVEAARALSDRLVSDPAYAASVEAATGDYAAAYLKSLTLN